MYVRGYGISHGIWIFKIYLSYILQRKFCGYFDTFYLEQLKDRPVVFFIFVCSVGVSVLNNDYKKRKRLPCSFHNKQTKRETYQGKGRNRHIL